MEISARSYLTAGLSLTAATVIALTPLAIPENPHTVALPKVTVADVQLTVTAADIDAFVANVEAVLDNATATVNDVAGVPGQTLIGLVNNNILTLIDDVFTGLIDGTDNQTIVASLTILKTLTYDAYVMLGVNLGRINPVITTTTAQVGELLTSALTGSLQNILTAVANVANDPLSLANYVGLLDAGIASGRMLVGNGLEAVQTLGDGAFEIVGIARDEVTFQFNNAVSGLSTLFSQLADASGNAIVQAVVATIRGLAIAPAAAAVNLVSSAVGTVLTTANAGFDSILDGATSIVASPLVLANDVNASAVTVAPMSLTLPTDETAARTDDVDEIPVVDAVDTDASVEEISDDETTEDGAGAEEDEDLAALDKQSEDDKDVGAVTTGLRSQRPGATDDKVDTTLSADTDSDSAHEGASENRGESEGTE